MKNSELGDDVKSLFDKANGKRRATVQPGLNALGNSGKFRVMSKKVPMIQEN